MTHLRVTADISPWPAVRQGAPMKTRTAEKKVLAERAAKAVRQAMQLAVLTGSVHGLPAHVGLQTPRKTKSAA